MNMAHDAGNNCPCVACLREDEAQQISRLMKQGQSTAAGMISRLRKSLDNEAGLSHRESIKNIELQTEIERLEDELIGMTENCEVANDQLENADKVIELVRIFASSHTFEHLPENWQDEICAIGEALATYDKSKGSAARKEPECKTCNDSTWVGKKGSRINCPTCSPFPGDKPFKPENLKATTMKDSCGYPVKQEPSPATPKPSDECQTCEGAGKVAKIACGDNCTTAHIHPITGLKRCTDCKGSGKADG